MRGRDGARMVDPPVLDSEMARPAATAGPAASTRSTGAEASAAQVPLHPSSPPSPATTFPTTTIDDDDDDATATASTSRTPPSTIAGGEAAASSSSSLHPTDHRHRHRHTGSGNNDQGIVSVTAPSNDDAAIASAYYPSTAMASLSVATPPATWTPDPMLAHTSQRAHADVDLAPPAAADGTSSPPPPPPLSSAYVQPPASNVTATETSGDGWSMVPRTDASYQGRDPAEPTNRRCVPTGSGADPAFPDVAFGERASPAVISFQRATGARGHGRGRGGSRALTPAGLSPARVDGSPNPSGLHRGGLRGLDESLDLAMSKVDAASSSPASPADAKPGAAIPAAAAHNSSTPLVPPATRKLCVRHQRMADEGTTARLQKSIESLPLADQTAVNTVWSLFSSSSHSRRALILQGILTMCCFSQLSLLSSELALAIRIDPFSLFPREVSLKVLGHLDAISLGRAAQVSRSWKQLADDDLLWRNMCEQHIERKCEKCGWGLPLLSERRRRVPGPGMQAGTPESRQLTIDPPTASAAASPTSNGSGPGHGLASGALKRTITAAANAAALEKQSRSRAGSPSAINRGLVMASGGAGSSSMSGGSDAEMQDAEAASSDGCDAAERGGPPSKRQRSCTDGTANAANAAATTDVQRASAVGVGAGAVASAQAPPAAAAAYKTRPWKSVYCERLAIERNWRRGRYVSRTLTGHTDGIMCLQFSEHLAHPAFPVVITGSYDRTARIWNLETGEQLRKLEGHTRGVRCLQFDEAKLITGSMDRTLKIWNWRTGALMRTLEGHTEGIVCLNFNEDTLASGSADSNVKIWNFRTGECYTLRGHHDWVNAVTLWTGPAAKRRLERRREAAGASKPGGRSARAGGGDDDDPEAAGTFLFSASDDGTIRLWDLGLRECLLTFDGHVGQVQSLKLVMMDESAVRKLMGGAAGGPGAERDHRRGGGVAEPAARARGSAAGRPHGRDGDGDGDDHDHDHDMMSVEDQQSYFLNEGAPPSSMPLRQRHQSSPRARDGRFGDGVAPCSANDGAGSAADGTGGAAGIPDRFYHAAAASGQHRSALADAQRRRRRKIEPQLARLQERLCAAGLVDPLPLDAEMGDIDMHLGDDEEQSSGDEQRQRASSRGRRDGKDSHHARQRPVLISGSLDNTLKVWDVRTGRCLRTLFGHVEGVWSLDVDKLRIVSASHDRTIKIWDRDSGFCQNTLVGHKGAVTCLSLGDDKIVSGSDDGDIKVWSFAAACQQAQSPAQSQQPPPPSTA